MLFGKQFFYSNHSNLVDVLYTMEIRYQFVPNILMLQKLAFFYELNMFPNFYQHKLQNS